MERAPARALRDWVRRLVGPGTVPHVMALGEAWDRSPSIAEAWRAYALRWRRRRLLWRAFRKRRQVKPVADRTAELRPGQILAFLTVRNEAMRLPFFLEHYRRLGVGHFLVVDNASTDDTAALLAGEPDVSLWTTRHGYKQSRFGLDWLTWLQRRHGTGHWCLTLDADEILVYPYHETRPLPALVEQLEAQGLEAMGALMLDLYPKGPLAEQSHTPGQNPLDVLPWFDAGNYVTRVQPRLGNLWIQGGPRARMFFADDPRRAPTLNKLPLVRWRRGYVYVNSTHAILPRRLNAVYDRTGGERISGALLHTKFLPEIVAKSAEERERREHFANSALYDQYYDRLVQSPDLWCETSTRYSGWRQLEALGLISRGGWV